MKKLSLSLLLFSLILLNLSCQKQIDFSNDIYTLKSAITAMKKSMDSLAIVLNTSTVYTNTRIDSLKIQILLINNRLTTLSAQLEAATVNISNILTQLTAINQDISNLYAQLALLGTSSAKRYYITAFYVDYAPAEVIDTTKWHYVAVLFFPDNRCEIYIDGLKKVDFYRPDFTYSFSRIYLGASYYVSWKNWFKGNLDELRISNIIRTQKEIQLYYDKSMGGNGLTANAVQILDASTIGLWHFDETGGSAFTNAVAGSPSGNLFGSYAFVPGKNGNSIYFDGTSGRGDCGIGMPSSNTTIEFWYKSSSTSFSALVQPYGGYSSDICYYSK